MSFVVQCLRLQASDAGGMGSIPGWQTKIPHAVCSADKKIFLKLEVSPFIRRLLRKRKGDVDRRKLEST